MKKNSIKTVLAMITLAFGVSTSAQELTLHNMEFLGQRHSLNPALNPLTRFYLTFYDLGMGFSNSFAVNDLREFDNNSDSFVWSTDKFLKSMKKNNATKLDQLINFSFGVKVNPKLFIHGSVAEKFQFRMTYPYDLFAFLLQGNLNEENIGKTMNIGGFRVNSTGYLDFSAGASYQLNCNLTIGARFKYLKGFANIYTKEALFNITTNPEYYQLTFENDLDFRTTLPDSNYSVKDLFKSKNNGMGIDLGATYLMLDNKLLLSASVIDLGYINWVEGGKRYYNKSQTKTFVFKGFDESSMSGSEDMFEKLVDTIKTTFDIEEETSPKYRTNLIPKIYLSGSYEIFKGNRVGAMMYGEIANKKLSTAWSVNAQLRLGRILNLQGNVSLINRKLGNIGLGVAANLGPIQWWVVTNNAGFLFFNPLDTRIVHFRTGINIALAYGKDKKNPCSPDYIPPGERNKKETSRKGRKSQIITPVETPPTEVPPANAN
ncbi:MAG: hypothetical protein J5I91_07655 [Bacteroidetes bacterium]|nr:hypothetical protein [Bacteroidota bacterium]